MRILTLHNKYLIRGGEDESCETENKLLARHGHVIETYFDDNRRVAHIGKVRTWFRTTWSFESYRIIRAKIRAFRPDIVNVHNFFPLISPAVYYAAAAERVAVVQTLHNYRLICPSGLLFKEGHICESCLGKTLPSQGIISACYHDSRTGSAAVAIMIAIHRIFGTWENKVSRYIVLTEFAKEKFIQAGLPVDRITVKPNFVAPDPGVGKGDGGFALFVGRLSQEKGIRTLIAAWALLSIKIPIKIVGDGPMSAELKSLLPDMPEVEWLGRRSVMEVYDLMGQAAFLIMPSEWYEGLPMTIVEAYAKGLPVLASNVGAMASLVNDGHSGLHFQPGNREDLASKVEWIMSHPEALARMRMAARKEFEAKYSEEINYRMIMKIYTEAIIVAEKSQSAHI